jgi:hypothetical protein
VPPDRGSALPDRRRIGEVDLVKLLELHGWTPSVQSHDLGTELDELSRDLLADARRAAGDDDAATVVAPEVLNLSHCS